MYKQGTEHQGPTIWTAISRSGITYRYVAACSNKNRRYLKQIHGKKHRYLQNNINNVTKIYKWHIKNKPSNNHMNTQPRIINHTK